MQTYIVRRNAVDKVRPWSIVNAEDQCEVARVISEREALDLAGNTAAVLKDDGDRITLELRNLTPQRAAKLIKFLLAN